VALDAGERELGSGGQREVHRIGPAGMQLRRAGTTAAEGCRAVEDLVDGSSTVVYGRRTDQPAVSRGGRSGKGLDAKQPR
jgi:hypothetical protein